jgi:putative acetyltransferase
MNIRTEEPGDYETIYGLVKDAFATAKVSNGTEHDFVGRLRAAPGYLPELALVAESDGGIVGHIMLTKTCIATDSGQVETLLLAPLAVALPYQRQRVGSRLVSEALARAKSAGYRSVFVVGDPAYYGRFGFKASVGYGIGNAPGVPDAYVMALELIPDALAGCEGRVTWME